MMYRMYRQLPAKFKNRLNITPDEWDNLVAMASLMGIVVWPQEKWISFVILNGKDYYDMEVKTIGSSMSTLMEALSVLAKRKGLVHYGGQMYSEVADAPHQ